MFARWSGTTIDCLDPAVIGAFWAALLEREPSDSLPGWIRLTSANDGAPTIEIQPVAERKAGKTRVHLDLTVEDIDAGMARVVDLGGRSLDERHDYDKGAVVVMADPEGTEFCLVQHYERAPGGGSADAEDQWVDRLGGLRNIVRQELIGRQLEAHVGADSSVLDVGCGQGTQAIRLARRGCRVVGLDPSPTLLAGLAAQARSAHVQVETVLGGVEHLAVSLEDRQFDAVCAHGLLMYLPDVDTALASLTVRVAPGGLLSLTFRNAAALAFRPGMRQQWDAALEAFDSDSYRNELGVDAKAHHLESIIAVLQGARFAAEAWYGVRVFTDPAPADQPLDDTNELDVLLRAEEEAGRRDPYRWLASQIHLLARRASAE